MLASDLYKAELRARQRTRFYDFFRGAWEHVDPAAFVDNWHLGAKAEVLEALHSGQIKRLAINEPPGCTKSKMASVCFPAWAWGHRPSLKWITTSYAQRLATRDAGQCKDLMRSEWYEDLFGDLLEPGGGEGQYKTQAGGLRLAVGIRGAITGFHADYHLIDDPNDPKETNPDNLIKAIEWKQTVLDTRRVNPAELRQLLIMQRVHDLDMAAHCVENEGFYVLRLPMRRTYAISSRLPPGIGEDPRAEGDLLWPERYPESVVREMEEVTMGPNVAAAQLQQDPVPPGGAIFKLEDLQHEVPMPAGGIWFQSWDMRFKDPKKTGDTGSYVVGQIWCVKWPHMILVHQFRKRVGFVDALDAIRVVCGSYPKSAACVLVEDKANGPAVVEMLQREIPGIREYECPPGDDKVARAHAVQGVFRAGKVQVLKDAPWLPEWRTELIRFPKAPNDDQVDATTQAIRHALTMGTYAGAGDKWKALSGTPGLRD